jgi:hypothetical protein
MILPADDGLVWVVVVPVGVHGVVVVEAHEVEQGGEGARVVVVHRRRHHAAAVRVQTLPRNDDRIVT